MNKPKSVIDIVRECKIPISSVYRRVRQLEKARLVIIHTTIISEDGKNIICIRAILNP